MIVNHIKEEIVGPPIPDKRKMTSPQKSETPAPAAAKPTPTVGPLLSALIGKLPFNTLTVRVKALQGRVHTVFGHISLVVSGLNHYRFVFPKMQVESRVPLRSLAPTQPSTQRPSCSCTRRSKRLVLLALSRIPWLEMVSSAYTRATAPS